MASQKVTCQDQFAKLQRLSMLPLVPIFMRREEKDAQIDHVVIENHPATTQSIFRDH